MSLIDDLGAPPTKNIELLEWVEETIRLCEPDSIRWCDGSDEEWNVLSDLMVEQGTLIRLNPEKHPNSFLARSVPLGRCSGRRSNVHLFAARSRCGPNE